MAPRSARRVSFAEPADSGVAAESPHPVADTHAYDPCPQPAACGHSAITAPEMPAAADEPEPDSVEEGGDKCTELSGHTRQVRDNPLEGASAPSSACCATSLACQSLTCVHAPQHQISLRPFQLPTGVQDVLLERARRILASGEGKFAPSPPPALLDSITDELLVVASDTVEAVATQAPTKPSGKAKTSPCSRLSTAADGARGLRGEASVLGRAMRGSVLRWFEPAFSTIKF